MKEFYVHLANGEVISVIVPARNEVEVTMEVDHGISRLDIVRVQKIPGSILQAA